MTSECTIPGVSPKYKLWSLSNNGVKCRFINFNKCITWYSIAEVVRDTICRPGVHGNYVFSVQLCHEQKVLLKIPITTSFTRQALSARKPRKWRWTQLFTSTQPSFTSRHHFYTNLCCCLVVSFVTPTDCSPPGSSPWDFPGKNTGVGCPVLLQGIFPINPEIEPKSPAAQADSLPPNYLGNPPQSLVCC